MTKNILDDLEAWLQNEKIKAEDTSRQYKVNMQEHDRYAGQAQAYSNTMRYLSALRLVHRS